MRYRMPDWLYRTLLTITYLAAAVLWAAVLTQNPAAARAAQAVRLVFHHVTINGHPVVCSEQVTEAPKGDAIPRPIAKPKPAVDRNAATNAETLRLNREELTRIDARLSALQNDLNNLAKRM